jgi:hypothetical protein
MRMPELHDLLERRASGYEPPSDLFERVLDRRRRRDRNRRVGTVVVALVAAGAAIGVLARAFMWGAGTRPADQGANGFVGEWASADYNHYFVAQVVSHQTMTISAGEDGVLHITAHDDPIGMSHLSVLTRDVPFEVCSTYSGTTMSGTGRLEDQTTLVVPSPVLACDDGSDPHIPANEEEGLHSYKLVLDPATDRLYDNLGVVWNQGAPPENWADPSTEAGVAGPGTFTMLHGEVTFRATEPWIAHVESGIDPRLFFLTSGPGLPDRLVTIDAAIEILVNPLPPDTPCDTLRLPPSAEELVQAIRSNPDLEATAPVTERVGGIHALRMDVVAAPGASIAPCGGVGVPVVSVPGRGAWGGVGPASLGRLYVLNLPGGSARTLAILITAPEAASFERAVEAAAPVLESFEFHAG